MKLLEDADLVGRAVLDGQSWFGEIEDGVFHVVEGDVFAWGEAPAGSPPAGGRRTGRTVPLADVTLEVPVPTARVINVMGGFVMPDRPAPADLPPMWLPKACNFPSGDGARIEIPDVLTQAVQMESELGVVVGRPLHNASPDECRDAIYGWTVFDDITAPEYGQMGFWAVGKSIDGFASWGPWIRRDLTEDRVMDGLAITATLNGEPAQAGNTKLFKFRPSEMISHICHRISLFPGDVVALGTPFPPAEVVAGDHAVCEVEEVGTLHNFFVSEGDR